MLQPTRLLCSVSFCLFLLCSGCFMQETISTPQPTVVPTPTPFVPPANATLVEIRTVVIKLVHSPQDRVRDFVVVTLDGSYPIYYDDARCLVDDSPYMYGPYDSIRHCEILQPDILKGIINDQAWLNEELTPFLHYLNCINGWVYLGRTDTGQETWFVEGFGFPAFCLSR